MLQDLVHHKNYGNAALLNSIKENEQASADPELRHLLHHIILANRFWVALFLGHPFDIDSESRVPESLDAVVALYRETHEREDQWISELHDTDLHRVLMTPFVPDRSFSLAQALMQVCLHSPRPPRTMRHEAASFRGHPPSTDFIGWLKERPTPNWSAAD
jgi:hypothetical protein